MTQDLESQGQAFKMAIMSMFEETNKNNLEINENSEKKKHQIEI